MALALLLCGTVGVVCAEDIIESEQSDEYENGLALLEQEKWEEAVSAFTRVIEEDSENAMAWHKLGGSYLNMGSAQEAYDAYLKATEIDQEFSEAFAMIGFVRLFFLSPPDSAGAVEALEKARPLFETDPGVHINYAVANILNQNYDEAIKELSDIIDADGKNARAWYYLGIAKSEKAVANSAGANLSDNEDLKESLEAFEKAVDINPLYKDALYSKGDVEGNLGLQEESSKSFIKLTAIEGDYAEPFRSSEANDSDVYYRIGVIEYNNENDTDAMNKFNKAIELNSRNHRAHYYRGIMLYAQDDMAGARKALESAVEIRDQFANAWYWLGRIDLREQNFSGAVEKLQKATEINDNLTDGWYFLGGVLGDYEDAYEQAAVAFTKVTEQTPDYANAWYFKGLNHYKAEQFTDASDAFERAVTLTSETFTEDLKANAYYLLGLMQTADGFTEQASKSFGESVALNSTDSNAWNAFGTVLNELQRYDEALDAFDKTLALDDSISEAWFNKGNVQRNLKKPEDALVSYEKAIALDPQPRVWNSKGMALMNLGRDEEAINAFESGIVLDSSLAVLWFNKAGALTNLGRYEEALVAVEEALALDSEYSVAITLKEQIIAKMGGKTESEGEDKFNFTPEDTTVTHDVPIETEVVDEMEESVNETDSLENSFSEE